MSFQNVKEKYIMTQVNKSEETSKKLLYMFDIFVSTITAIAYTVDTARAATYLALSETKYVTGAEMNIDGGILAGSVAAPKTRC